VGKRLRFGCGANIIEDEDAGDVIVCPWLNAEGGVSTYPVNNTTSGGGFCTIQAAIDAASNGDHIDVMAGNYDETINIENFSGLSISGEDPSTTIIKSSSTLPWNVGTYGSSGRQFYVL
jgi:pectin methylesterase-like acyl-CoA thioesterase